MAKRRRGFPYPTAGKLTQIFEFLLTLILTPRVY